MMRRAVIARRAARSLHEQMARLQPVTTLSAQQVQRPIDLDALPEADRDEILRDRLIREQIDERARSS